MTSNGIEIKFGDVKEKSIITPNHFISHMIEHIAWRLGLSISLNWTNQNWLELGRALGQEINKFPKQISQSSSLGMIDDGSALVAIEFPETGPELKLSNCGDVELAYFLKLRCEQLESGESLVELLQGLAVGLHAKIEVTVCSLEDMHHSWEGVFRAIGIALSRVYTPLEPQLHSEELIRSDGAVEKNAANSEIEISVLELGINRAVIRRGTAETGITLAIDFKTSTDNSISFDVDSSITQAIEGFSELFFKLSKALGATVTINFKSKMLSSSHVVMEDIGLVFGRALLEILKLRMEKYGANGAGSNVKSALDQSLNKVHVAISVEGRKFWKILSQQKDQTLIKKNYILGVNAQNNLRAEDLDDFIDGLAGGLSASIIIIIQEKVSAKEAWENVFTGLGLAIKEAFCSNPYRKGVPPGVKATLV